MAELGLIDPHTHLLPFVDDGCRDFDDSLACARRLVANGYTHAACTSHYLSDWGRRPPGLVREEVENLQAVYDDAGVPLTLLPGGEVSMMRRIEGLDRGEFTPLGNGNAVLFDTWCPTEPDGFYDDVRHLMDLGFQPVLAHPERIEFVSRPRDDVHLDKLAEMGVLLQGNLECLAMDVGTDQRDNGERWLREGRYFMLGSDTHRPDKMDTRMQGLANARGWVDAETFRELTTTNPAQLLAVQ